MTRHTNAGASIYGQRDSCPARYHDSYSATRRAGCVCPAAKEARRKYIKRQQLGRLEGAYVDPTGTRRRLLALGAIGYPLRALSAEIGWTGNVGRLIWSQQRVHRHTAQAVAAAYERLSGTPGPSQRARDAAKRSGYAPPLAWEGIDIDDPDARPNLGGEGAEVVDEIAVRRVLAGAMPWKQLRDAEKLVLMRDHADRYGVNELCRALGISGGTHAKWRALVTEAIVA